MPGKVIQMGTGESDPFVHHVSLLYSKYTKKLDITFFSGLPCLFGNPLPHFYRKSNSPFFPTFYFCSAFRRPHSAFSRETTTNEVYVLNQYSWIDFIYDMMKSTNRNLGANIDVTGNLVSSKPESCRIDLFQIGQSYLFEK